MVGLFSFCISIVAASAETSIWQIAEISDTEMAPVGYIYYTSAIGTQINSTPKKVVTSLRLVCSTKISTQRDNDPLIILFWNTMNGNTPQSVTIGVDKNTPNYLSRWQQEGPILLRSVNESKEIMQRLKTNKSIKFSWITVDGVQHLTIFDLRTFGVHLSEFNALCKTTL